MGGRLQNRVAIVTGAGRGIGQQIAYHLAAEGAAVVVNDLPDGTPTSPLTNIEAGCARTTAQEITGRGGRAIAHCCSVSGFEDTRGLVQAAVDSFGGLDILVNNAAVLALGMPWELSEQQWDEVNDVNLKGTFNCVHHAARIFRDRRWGRIVNCSSISALGTTSGTVYGAAKAGVLGLTNSVAWDMRDYGVTCNAIFPQARQLVPEREAMAQALFRSRLERGQIATHAEYERIRRRPTPEAIAPFVTYLSTDEAGYINGELFFVRGGKIAVYNKPAPRSEIVKSSENSDEFWTLDELVHRVPELVEA